MQRASYYREQAARARRLAGAVSDRDDLEMLRRMAEDFDDIAAELEAGAVEIEHPSRLPQREHPR
jgi:hypothetical protein